MPIGHRRLGVSSNSGLLEKRREPDLDLNSLPSVIADQYYAEAVRRDVNVSKALLIAAEELENDESPAPEKAVDGDWIRRWRDIVGEVSSDELQSIWARLLAGEVKSPGAHSLHTLEVLRNISSDDAQMIAKLAGLSIDGFIWRHQGQNHFERLGLSFTDLLYLEEIGILSGASSALSNTWKNARNGIFHAVIAIGNDGLTVTKDDPNASLQIHGMMFTRAGSKLIELCEAVADSEYLEALGNHFKGEGFVVEICRVEHQGDGQVLIFPQRTL